MSEWLNWIDEKRKLNFVRILVELSRLQDKKDLNFVIIGALTLLMQGYLKYTAYYDIDLLFRNITRLKEFIGRPKSHSLQIVNYDEELMIGEKITSFHTAWSFTKTWFNVDYIMRPGMFEFYTEDHAGLKLYTTLIELKEDKFPIELYIAHAYDIFVEKVLSPRLENDIDLKVDMSVDIRHIYLIYNQEMTNQNFWEHIQQKITRINRETEFKRRLLTILRLAPEIGYGNIEIPDFVSKILQY